MLPKRKKKRDERHTNLDMNLGAAPLIFLLLLEVELPSMQVGAYKLYMSMRS